MDDCVLHGQRATHVKQSSDRDGRKLSQSDVGQLLSLRSHRSLSRVQESGPRLDVGVRTNINPHHATSVREPSFIMATRPLAGPDGG